MVLVTVLYPNTAGSRFDQDYYVQKHIPLVKERWSSMGLQDARIVRGVGAPGGGDATFQVIALLTFESQDALQKALAAHGAEIVGDVAQFTDVQPIIQVNEPFG